MKTSTELLFSAVPVINSVLSLVIPSLLLLPVSFVIETTLGALGSVRSISTTKSADETLVFPATSVIVAVKV